MKTIKLFLIFACIIGYSSIHAQDIIVQKNADTLQCDIKEIGTEEIKYTLPGYPTDVLFAMSKEKIRVLIFENGQEMSFMNEMDNPMNYADQNKNAIKLDFLSPLTGNTTFAYERSLKPGMSLEGTLGIIGLGYDPNDYDPRGSFVKFGVKFIKSPDFYLKGMRYAHILKGGYIKPEIGFSYFTKLTETYDYRYPDDYGYDIQREDYVSFVVQVVLGKQWVINDVFLVDFYGGLGYGFDGGDGEYYYGYAISPEVPLSFSAGLKIGILF
jgi:hypothetical protein